MDRRPGRPEPGEWTRAALLNLAATCFTLAVVLGLLSLAWWRAS